MAQEPPVLELALGKGEWIVGFGKCGGAPALFFEPASKPHTTGEQVTPEDKLPINSMPRGGLIISFCEPLAIEVLKEAISRMENK